MKRAPLVALLLVLVLLPPHTQAQAEHSWPMAGANPERTSWTPEEVRGRMHPEWAVNIEPYIPSSIQMIAAYDTIYVSTAKGLYALNSETGALRWVFPTELPLGHSPSVEDGVVYVGGYDRHLYALDAYSGRELWHYVGERGFATNPLVVEEKIILGNRDGYLYAVNTDGTLAWRFRTDGPILFSAAYKDGVVYFASNDSHAYAVHIDGTLKWKSAKLPGSGFHSYWPVIYTKDGHDYVVLGGSNDYRVTGELRAGSGSLMNHLDKDGLYYDIPEGELVGPTGTEPGDWAPGTITIDNSRAIEYLQQHPSRRRVFVLHAASGDEYTFDSNGDGHAEYAPVTWFGTHGGNRYPAVVGSDGVLYHGNSYISNPHIPRGGPSGWKFGTPHISRVHEGTYGAVDEPMAVSGGGDLLYWGWLGGIRGMGAYDITLAHGDPARSYTYGVSGSPSLPWLLETHRCPGAGLEFGVGTMQPAEPLFYTAGGALGAYAAHGNPNPAIPYRGRIYFHSMNTVFALSEVPASCHVTSLLSYNPDPTSVRTTKDNLRQELVSQVQKILDAGHLRPGFHEGTLATTVLCLEQNSYMVDYFRNPAETFITLINTLPHLSPAMQQQVRAYLQSKWLEYGEKVHIGWQSGAAREAYLVPPETEVKMTRFGPRTSNPYSSWEYRYSLYGRWRYIEELGDRGLAEQVFAGIRDTVSIVPPEDDPQGEWWAPGYYLPYVKNAFIAGYVGYVGIGRMADISEDELSPYVAELERLLTERAAEFSTDQPEPTTLTNVLTVARNFLYMTPELAGYLSANARPKAHQALEHYYQIAPYWFVSRHDATSYEGVVQPLYDYPALFQAKAMILREPFDELVKWLDVPAFERGDLFYIQNLIAAIEAPYQFAKTAERPSGCQGDTITYTLEFRGQAASTFLTDTLPAGISRPIDVAVEGTDVWPRYDPDAHALEWSDTPGDGEKITIRYSTTIVTGVPKLLVNTARLETSTEGLRTTSATIFANPRMVYLPMVKKAR